MSLGFRASLLGVGMTLMSWYGPWQWPAWPAFATIDLLFGQSGFAELPYATRSAAIVLLIIVNSGFWGLLAAGLTRIVQRVRRRNTSAGAAQET